MHFYFLYKHLDLIWILTISTNMNAFKFWEWEKGRIEHHFLLYMYVYEADILPRCDGFAWVPEKKNINLC